MMGKNWGFCEGESDYDDFGDGKRKKFEKDELQKSETEMGIPSTMRDAWANRRNSPLIASPAKDQKILNSRRCTQDHGLLLNGVSGICRGCSERPFDFPQSPSPTPIYNDSDVKPKPRKRLIKKNTTAEESTPAFGIGEEDDGEELGDFVRGESDYDDFGDGKRKKFEKDEGVRAGVKAASIACVGSAVPTLESADLVILEEEDDATSVSVGSKALDQLRVGTRRVVANLGAKGWTLGAIKSLLELLHDAP
ncbi:hypothetical protein LOK49_LG03G01395 [Camellia lanceoleosa]|uniref:Uncharacterized protein n=1 Tax=Camellia lanceoleosa TaxID=1840588 RepID=A0ACC0IAB6_9ERIC|nr:hypothetical protein LOK49_LG03G01395 [Camellia lanceoleosa]